MLTKLNTNKNFNNDIFINKVPAKVTKTTKVTFKNTQLKHNYKTLTKIQEIFYNCLENYELIDKTNQFLKLFKTFKISSFITYLINSLEQQRLKLLKINMNGEVLLNWLAYKKCIFYFFIIFSDSNYKFKSYFKQRLYRFSKTKIINPYLENILVNFQLNPDFKIKFSHHQIELLVNIINLKLVDSLESVVDKLSVITNDHIEIKLFLLEKETLKYEDDKKTLELFVKLKYQLLRKMLYKFVAINFAKIINI